MMAVVVALSIATAGMMAVSEDPSVIALLQVVIQVAVNLIAMPMMLAIIVMGIRRAVGAEIYSGSVFSCYSKMLPLFATMVLVYIMVIIGLILFVLPGIYLMVAYYMAMPLVVEKNMSPWQAMEVSRKAITHRWFSVFGLFLVMGIILAVSMLPLGLGLIWTLPMFVIAFGILYRNMFGVEAVTVS